MKYIFFITLVGILAFNSMTLKSQSIEESIAWINLKSSQIMGDSFHLSESAPSQYTVKNKLRVNEGGDTLFYYHNYIFIEKKGEYSSDHYTTTTAIHIPSIEEIMVKKCASNYSCSYAIKIFTKENSVGKLIKLVPKNKSIYFGGPEMKHETSSFIQIVSDNSSEDEVLRIKKALLHLAKLKGAKMDETYKEDTF